MTTDKLLEVLTDRGFTLKMGTDGTPLIHGPRDQATPALLRVLKIHRDRLIEQLKRREGT